MTATSDMTNPWTCCLCGGTEHTYLFTKGSCRLHQCHGCGLVFQHPQPTDEQLREIYSPTYFLDGGDTAMETAVETVKRETAGFYLEPVMRRIGSARGRLLDVGCGRGEMLLEADARGFDVTGIDLSPHAVATANERLGRPATIHADLAS